MPGHGALLQRKIALAAPLLHPWSAAFWSDARLAERFPTYLATIHGSVRATVPLMNAAVAALTALADDPLRAPLTEYLVEHADEERAHEEWLLQDLEAIGMARTDVLRRVAPPAVARLVGAQYYWINHAHPVALLGFFAVLEGYPPTMDHLQDIEARTGLPAAAFRMLRHHAELDPVHGRELFDLLDRLPLGEQHAALLGASALQTIGSLADLFRHLVVSPAGDRPMTRAIDG